MIIKTAAPEEWPAALEIALQHLDEGSRHVRIDNALALLSAGEIDPRGIFVAHDGAGLRGVQVTIPLAGASALFWVPRTTPDDEALADCLVRAALDWLPSLSSKLAQAILSPGDAPAAAALVRCGFQAVTRLHYLEHPLNADVGPGTLDIRIETYEAHLRDVFYETLLRSYEGSLDCPELNGVRTIEEVVAGHAAQGIFRPELWWLAFQGGLPVAAVLVNQVPDREAWDLSYLGVVPEARRHGIGRHLTMCVLDSARKAGVESVVLAVDERNQPAFQLYEGLGFVSTDVRDVYLHLLGRSLAADAAGAR